MFGVNALVLQSSFGVTSFVNEVVFLKMPSRQEKKRAKRHAKYLEVRDDVLESARASYKTEPEKKRTAERERYQAEPEPLNASGIKQSQKRNGPLNASGIKQTQNRNGPLNASGIKKTRKETVR